DLTDLILTLRPSVPALAEYFGEWLDAWPLDSEQARRAKRAYEERKQWESEHGPKLLDPPPAQRISVDLAETEAGETTPWIDTVFDLSLTATSAAAHIDPSGCPTETHGWKTAEPATRARIIDAAKMYLLRHDPGDSSWLGKPSLPYSVIAGRNAW